MSEPIPKPSSLPPQKQPLRSLYVDLNSYFASVEQQLNPELRGRPIAVTPVMADGGCCLAASYEAKRFGVRTGTRVGEARALCPEIVFVKSRFREYIAMHHRIIAAVDSCLPVEQVLSVDEVSCRLARGEREPHEARALAERVKAAIAERAGECLRCSIGIAPNRFLAKLATELQKPDGLVVLETGDLPGRLIHLKLIDIPGIGRQMDLRLRRAGIGDVRDLYAASESDLERAWGGVMGRYWHRWLRGEETDQRPTQRRSIGHQHVLPPDCRTRPEACAVAVRLLHKAAARMRHLDYFAQRLSLSVGFAGQRRGPWGSAEEQDERNRTFHTAATLPGGKQDTITLAAVLRELWATCPDRTPNFVSVTLSELLPRSSVTGPLFPEEQQRERLSQLIDELDASHGPMTVYTGAMHEARKRASGGIAFRGVPDLSLPDSIGP